MLTKEERAKHWSNGAEDYDWYIKQELSGFKADWWYELIMEQCERKEGLRILDCGCGPGFFSVILSKNSNKVIGIDQSECLWLCKQPPVVSVDGTLITEARLENVVV